jgi:hypothetical protein
MRFDTIPSMAKPPEAYSVCSRRTRSSFRGMAFGTLVALSTSYAHQASAQKMDVKIIQRQNGETSYSYVVPAHSTSSSNANVNCSGDSGTVNCTGSSTTNGYSSESRPISYSVTGATFSLLLPDGRIAVVNCVSKYKPKGDYINQRSCRMPVVDEIQAEFKGKNAKLLWPVSLDGKKLESETYTILGILAK